MLVFNRLKAHESVLAAMRLITFLDDTRSIVLTVKLIDWVFTKGLLKSKTAKHLCKSNTRASLFPMCLFDSSVIQLWATHQISKSDKWFEMNFHELQFIRLDRELYYQVHEKHVICIAPDSTRDQPRVSRCTGPGERLESPRRTQPRSLTCCRFFNRISWGQHAKIICDLAISSVM